MHVHRLLMALVVGLSACVPIFGDFEFKGSGGSTGASTGQAGSGGQTSTGSTGGSTGSTGSTSSTSSSSTSACGDCLGGDCVGGVCQPVAVATGQAMPSSIAVSADDVFWVNAGNGSVMRAPIAGGTATPVATGQNSPGYLMLDAVRVYWATDVDIQSAPLQGTGPTPVTSLGSYYVRGLAGDGAYLYWQTSTSQIWRVQATGGTPGLLTTAQPDQYTIAVDASKVYWADNAGVVSMAKTGGSLNTLVTHTAGCVGGCSWPLIEKGGFLYFQALDGQAPAHFGVKKLSTSGTSTVDLGVGELTRIQSIAVDGADVYLANGALLRVPSAGGGPVTTVFSSGVSKVAVDSKQVYWTDSNGGAVYRLAR